MATVLSLHDVEESRAATARFYVSSTCKANAASNEAALLKLMATGSPSQQVAMSRFVLATVASSTLGDRQTDEGKLGLFRSLVAKALDREQGITLIADVFELCGSVIQSVDRAQDIVASLALSRAQTARLLLSLTFSSTDAWRDIGHQLLARHLESTSADEVRQWFAAPAQEGHLVHFAMAAAQNPHASVRTLAEALGASPLSSLTAPVMDDDVSFSVAKVVEELGPAAISTAEDCKELLSMFPLPLSERAVAELLALVASPSLLQSQEVNAYHSLRVSVGLAESRTCNPSAPPQVNTVLAALKDTIPPAIRDNSAANRDYWQRVMVALDQPSIRVERFATIAAAYKKSVNDAIPVWLFLNHGARKWRNTSVQAAAIKFALDNPDLVGKDVPSSTSGGNGSSAAGATGASSTGSRVRSLPKDVHMPDDVSDLWRLEAFVDTVVHVSARERELDSYLTQVSTRTVSAFLTVVLGCPAPTVRHFSLASQALKSAVAANAPLTTIVTQKMVSYFVSESCVPSLVGLLSELVTSDASRTFEVAEVCVELGLTDAVLKCSSCTRLVVQVAIIGRETKATPDKWLEQALSETNRSRPNQAHSRYAIAASILESADDLISKQKYGTYALHALQLLQQSSIASAVPIVAAHAKQLAQGDNAFTPDVEEEATQFFNRIYSDDTVAPMTLIERLQRSTNARDKQVLSCIIHILFEETRSLSDYPWKQLQTAARLFGQLINSEVLGAAKLQQALKLLLPTILKQTDMKTYEYGMMALEQFKMRLLEWPAVGKQLKSVTDLDMRIPGIVGIINIGIQKAAEEEEAANANDAADKQKDGAAAAGQATAAALTGSTAPGLHQLDIRVLVDKNITYSAPPPVVQDQINFLVGNTDPNNIDTNASELASLLKPEFFAFFADYLVVKRVSLEPNFHRMYLQLVEKVNNRELEKRIRGATVNAVKRLLSSDRIRTDTSERSLLKNLGSWLGCITLAKNIPVLARDLDFKELLYQGLREGKLIAVVPFVAKVLDQAINSKYFRPPNPWTMAQLGHLFEMYRLPDLKLTLRFEVEVLCKNINITVAEVEEVMRAMYPGSTRRGTTMLDIRNQLDINGSTDFRVEEQRQAESPPPKKGLQADAAPYQPRVVPPVEVQPPPRPPVVITPETVRAGDELRHLPPTRHQAYHQALVKTLEPALKEVQAHVERASVIAAYSAREIVAKDFARDPDPNLLRRAGQAMARSLASNLCSAIVKEHLWTALRKHLHVLASHLSDNAQTRNDITEMVANNNFDLCTRFLEYQSNELAGRKVDELLAPLAEEKAAYARKGEMLPIPADQLPLQPLLCTLPETLRPMSNMPQAQRNVYEDFFQCVPVVEQLAHLIRIIEEAALRHYQTPNAEVLSLTNPQFTEKQLSEHHVTIRGKLVEVAHLITPETAVPLIGFVFARLMDITDNLTRIDISRPEMKALVSTTQFLNEVFLFVIQSTNEKGKDKSMSELTRCYLGHERRWKYGDIVVNFIRLRVIDVLKFDEALSKALQESPSTRTIVEFAGQVIQKVLIDDKLATTKDLAQTLAMLEQIARNRSQAAAAAAAQQQQQQQILIQQQQQQQGFGGPAGSAQAAGAGKPLSAASPTTSSVSSAPGSTTPAGAAPAPMTAKQSQLPQSTAPLTSPATPISGGGVSSSSATPVLPYGPNIRQIRVKSAFPSEKRAEIEPLFDEWIAICQKKSLMAQDPTTAQSDATTGGAGAEHTQVLSMQFVKKLQQTNMLLTDRNQLDAFIGVLIELSVEHYATVALEQERTAGIPAQPVMPKGAPPPHRFAFTPDLFLKCDAFSDLVVLLVRCCSWSQSPAQSQENTSRAEVALIGRVLQVTMRVLQNHHDAIQHNLEGPPLSRPDCAYQKVFLQQPYVRMLSNLLIAIHRNHSETPSTGNEPPTTTEEILRFLSEALRNTPPMKAPAFTFGWLEMVSHRLFVVRMLKNKKLWPHYVALLCEALKFIESFTKGSSGVASNVLVFVKAFLKLMLILLHDFPEFVLSWHVQLCDAIPPSCVQLRNVVLCAFPHQIKLPDPFAQSLQIDRLPDMLQAPPLQEAYRKSVFSTQPSSPSGLPLVSPEDIAAYVHSNPRSIPPSFPRTVVDALRSATGRWNVPLMNALVLHTACTHLAMTNQAIHPNFTESPALELFRELTKLLDNEGRYYFINACANHLRYPNSHTHYFSQVLLHLFLPSLPHHAAQLASHQEVIQEQVTRVLVERLIISRPHPWGLLITFIELIKNKRYGFWEKGFIRCTPEIEKMFESLLKSITGSTQAAAAAAAAAAQAAAASQPSAAATASH